MVERLCNTVPKPGSEKDPDPKKKKLSHVRGASQLSFFYRIPARTRSILVQKNRVHPSGLRAQKSTIAKTAQFCQLQ
jgi:hypothetical protein